MSVRTRTRSLWDYHAEVPDNHVSETFLERLVLNADVQARSYWAAVQDAQPVSLQLSVVVLAVEVFLRLLQGRMSATTVIILVLSLTIAGQVFVRAVGGVLLLSPLLATLTKAISDDTIVAASTWLLLLHLYLHDYYFVTSVADKVTGGLSLACAVGSSVLLASRLREPTNVFAQVVFSLALFIIFPFTCRHVEALSRSAYSAIVCAAASASVYLMLPAPPLWPLALAALHLGLVFLCPWFLLHIGKFKAEINGPWDEAIPRVSTVLQHKEL